MSFEKLNLSRQMEIDRCCDEYERALSTGNANLRDFLERFTGDAHTQQILAEELVALEIENANRQGRIVLRETLLGRLPDEVADREGVYDRAMLHASATVSKVSGPKERVRKTETPSLQSYEFLRLLGRGAFGEVWKAVDRTLNRTVAVKTPHNPRLGSNELARFKKEAQLAARLKHPNIVSVLETVTESDRPYIVTDYVDGTSLNEWSHSRELTWREISDLFIQICGALEHAHENGVIHRDLKPTNILVDRSNRPIVADFGLARGAGDETLTIEGSPLGSPAYMSPEQARGDRARCDERADLFAVGVMLYELLTGERPFRGQRDAILHQVLHSAPTPLRQLNIKIPIDLETICLKCLSKDPNDRYASAAELMEELERYRDGKPIQARPLSVVGRAGLWMKRNPVLSAISGIATLALLALAIGGPLTARRLASEVELREKEIEQRQKREYVSDMIVAQQAIEHSNFRRARVILKKYENSPALKKWRCFEWFYLRDQVTQIGKSSTIIGKETRDMAVSPDGKRLAISCAEEDVVFVYDLPNLTNPRRFGHDRAHGVAFHPNSKKLACGGTDGAKIFSVSDGTQALHLPDMLTWQLAYSADGRYLAGCKFKESRITVWDAKTNTEFEIVAEGKQFYDVAFSPVTNQLAAASFSHAVDQQSRDGALVIWDVVDGAIEHQLEFVLDGMGRFVTFSVDGDLVAVTTMKAVELWKPSTGECLRKLPFLGAESVAFATDGSQLATGGVMGSVAVWELDDSDPIRYAAPFELVGHSSFVDAVSYSPLGDLYSMGKVTGEIINWGKPESNENLLTFHSKAAYRLAIFPDGQTVLSGGGEGDVFHTDIASGKRLNTIALPGKAAQNIRLSPSGNLVATLEGDRVLLLNAQTFGEHSTISGNGEQLNDVQFAPNGKWLAISTAGGKVRIIDLDGHGQQTYQLRQASKLEFSVDGRLLAVTNGPELVCFDLEKQVEKYRCTGHTQRITAVSASPRGILATCSRDSFILLWDAATGERIYKLPTMGNYVMSLAFSPDGKTLALGGVSRMKLWNMEAMEETLLLSDRWGPINDIKFSQDGRKLLAGGFNGEVRVWHAPH